MITVYLIITATVLFISAFLFQKTKKPDFYPPGPNWLPIVGCISEFRRRIRNCGGIHLALTDLYDQFQSNVVGLKLGGENVIVVYGYETVKKVFTREEFEGRPDNFFIRLRSMGTRKGITGTDGPHWHEQRTFVMRHLRDVGFGKRTMELKIIEELKEIIHIIDNGNSTVKMADLFAPSVLNVLWALTAGANFKRDDTKLMELLHLLHRRARAFDMSGGTLSQFPWLRFIAPEKSGYNLLLRINKELYNFFMETIYDHHKTYTDSNKNDDFIYAFIQEMKAHEGENSRFTNDQLMMICLDLFIAGSQTTSSTLGFIFLIMILRPDIQKRAQIELDQIVPSERSPELIDRPKLPYIEAILLEIRRLFVVTAVAGPRRILKDTHLDGYFLAKETTVLISIWSVHMDKEYWKDPEVFRPERFLTPDGKFVPDERVLTFGLGRRRCPGEALARSCIFLFFTGILKHYNIIPDPESPLPEMKPLPGLILDPPPFNVKIVRR